ncbi:MAG: acyl-CoA dehydrogenase family protein [Thermoanaerobacteraceae bacterium]|nr:acyl-CoA dehydrogenase family protein [Thermoanaerobacteraceae bacterium]
MSGSYIKGGSFLIETVEPRKVFTPEDFTDEHKMIAETAANFVAGEVEPKLEELEAQKEGLMRELLEQAAELGLLAADIPEEYGGMELDKISSMLITENIVRGGSFSLGHGAHTGIGSLPIVFFGNRQQKEKYLPALANGEKFAAYALTEPGAGSDALSARTKAVLSEDGKYYILNGTKQFITNAGFADVFVTYAKVDGEKFTAFIVDADTKGVSLGAEEKKLGIKGSSTRSVIFEDAKVPVENVLYEIGKGHVVAFNILNIGRYKLAVGCIGSAKLALENAVKYAKERRQFGQPIASFGLIKDKIGTMAAKIYASESMAYRTGGLIDAMLQNIDMTAEDSGMKTAKGIAEYAVECSINKIHGSEVLDYVADEALQIYGGYGYTQEYPAERIYRDSRINRIFEGTNEINRLIIPGTLLRKAMKGELPLLAAAKKLQEELLTPSMPVEDTSFLGEQKQIVEKAKKIVLLVAGAAARKYGEKLQQQQEVLGRVADLVIETFAMESALLRALKVYEEEGREAAVTKELLAKIYISDAFGKMDLWAREALAAVEEGDALRTVLAALRKLTRHNPVNVIALKRQVADKVIEAEKYMV